MSQVYTELCDVDPMQDDITVVARCISIWHSHAKGRPNDPWSLDAGFMDPLGNRMQATIRRESMAKFGGLLEEGSCYRIRNFGVGENGGKYPFLSHKYKTNFFKNTALTRMNRFDTNHNGFKFEPFLRFTTRRWSEQFVFDINEWYEWWSSGRKEAARKASLRQIAKDEKEFKRSKPRVGSVEEEDAADVGFSSEEEDIVIDYDNLHLAFDPEKSPKFNC
ncbi:hypothetical protein CTI12_AA619570 [Artemisia annua]|uniref:Replication protein A 70 kDa DNA-binding subunit B/D first OB fold domain-containing protein n=1 Tax=Artemisia annua TaxID=35608 RepID=A0A2U1KCJ4_ARTAN|nr:hypothetical protein CTI12_AA619570 [Artemisia annua]